MTGETLYFTTYSTVIGNLVIAGGPRGVRHLSLLEANDDAVMHLERAFANSNVSFVELDGFFASTTTAIDAYFNAAQPLHIPYDLEGGTALQRMVWLAIAKIPYGETISYSALAASIGFPRAVRAVASACGANPVPLIIPCHRVVAKDGTLGGFSLGGLEVKELLLSAEERAVNKTLNEAAA